MFDRLNLGPLARGVWDGLRDRKPVGEEPADRPTRRLLLWAPIGAAVLLAVFRIELDSADELIGGLALLIGALIGAFGLVAGWKERLAARNLPVDGTALRALDEAAAHILMSVFVSAVATAAFGALAQVAPAGDSLPKQVAATALGAIGVASSVYIFLSLWIVVNLLWDAYERASGKKTTS